MTFIINNTISDSFAEKVKIIVGPFLKINTNRMILSVATIWTILSYNLKKLDLKTTWSFWVSAFCQVQKLGEQSFYLQNLFIAGGHILADS